jgi:2-polyprenyl-3-methyl-5-hydroxy-6-metoxy-1,4-benzoquinol methylase
MYYFTIFLTDLGANIGAFTLAVAAMGRKVKAVDAGFENLSYMRYI